MVSCSDVMRPFVWAECAQHIHVNVLPGCFQISRANPKRPQTLKRGFVLETHWRHLGPSQTCFVSLLGFVSFSTYFPIRNQLQLVTLWKGPRTLSVGCVWMASWVDSPQVCDLRRPGSAVRMFMRPFVWAECAQQIHVNVLPGCFQISRANPKRLQLLKRGFVLETHWHHLFGSGVRQK